MKRMKPMSRRQFGKRLGRIKSMTRFVKMWSMEDRAQMIDDLTALKYALDDSITELEIYQSEQACRKRGIDPYNTK